MSFLAVILWTLAFLGTGAYMMLGIGLLVMGPRWWWRVVGGAMIYSLFVVGLMLPTWLPASLR